MSTPTKRRRRGFTMVEMLMTVLIILILMSVALPAYLSAVVDAQKKTCRSNMQTIANTVFAAKVKSGAADFSSWNGNTVATLVAFSPDKVPDLTKAPTCPNGGTYSISVGNTGTNSTFKVSCNTVGLNAHGSFQPGIDSN